MGVLQVLVFVTSVVLVLENGSQVVECAPSGTYSYTTVHRSSSSNNAIAPAASHQQIAVAPAGTYTRNELKIDDYRRYLPVEDTPEVKKAREQFFKLYQKQAKLAADAEDKDLDGTYTQTHVAAGTRDGVDAAEDYYYYDYEGDDDDDEYEEYEYEGEEDSEEDDEDEEESEEESDDEEDSSEEDSSSSEEDGVDSSEEDGGEDSSSEEGEDSSEEEWGEDSSSSSSSSSSSEEDDEGSTAFSWGSTAGNRYQPLDTNALNAPKAVTDTPAVKQAKIDFFKLYKTQAELAFNAPDDY